MQGTITRKMKTMRSKVYRELLTRSDSESMLTKLAGADTVGLSGALRNVRGCQYLVRDG